MRSLSELLKAEAEGQKLTNEERRYLDKYKETKQVRHSASFVYHKRKLPNEPPANRD